MSKSLNIVELIEQNPITRLSNTYQNKLLNKIKERFTDDEQQIFIASFYCYLNYQNEFIIDLDNIWKWLGFQSKFNSKRLLETQFIINKDYILLIPTAKQTTHIKGGHNKETFMLNIKTFKKFCLKAGTKKADEIHEYYIKLEETFQEVID
jgi:phage anti-repressor protein